MNDYRTNREPRFHGEVSEKSRKTMKRIKGRDTSVELTLRKALWQKGYRYRKNCIGLPGSPDIVIANFSMERTGNNSRIN